MAVDCLPLLLGYVLDVEVRDTPSVKLCDTSFACRYGDPCYVAVPFQLAWCLYMGRVADGLC